MFTIQSIMANLLGALSLAMFVLAIVAVPSQVVHADDDPCARIDCGPGEICVDGNCVAVGAIQCSSLPGKTCDCFYIGTVPDIGHFCRTNVNDQNSSANCDAANCRCWWSNGPQSPPICTHP